MSIWDDYVPEEGGSRLEPGDYRCEVVDVEETTSKKGLPMLVITVKPNGSNIRVKHYIVKNEYFNRNVTSFLDSFGIDRQDHNTLGWIGAVGAAKFDKDENGYLKVKWFLSPKQAEKLPPWEGPIPVRQTVTTFQEIDGSDGDLPF